MKYTIFAFFFKISVQLCFIVDIFIDLIERVFFKKNFFTHRDVYTYEKNLNPYPNEKLSQLKNNHSYQLFTFHNF